MVASVLGGAAYVLPQSHFVPDESRTVPVPDAVQALKHTTPATALAGASPGPATEASSQAIAATVLGPPVEVLPSRAHDPERRANVRHTDRRGAPEAADAADRAATFEAQAPAVSDAPAPQSERTPVVIAEVTRTRWQSMDDAMAACSGGFFERLLCRQKARIAFCDGYWGVAPQCATAAPTDAIR